MSFDFPFNGNAGWIDAVRLVEFSLGLGATACQDIVAKLAKRPIGGAVVEAHVSGFYLELSCAKYGSHAVAIRRNKFPAIVALDFSAANFAVIVNLGPISNAGDHK